MIDDQNNIIKSVLIISVDKSIIFFKNNYFFSKFFSAQHALTMYFELFKKYAIYKKNNARFKDLSFPSVIKIKYNFILNDVYLFEFIFDLTSRKKEL